MLVAFRVDSSVKIGTGHLSRCINLANALSKQGFKSLFIINNNEKKIHNLIKSNNHQFKDLDIREEKKYKNNSVKNFKSWLGHAWQKDATETLLILKEYSVEILIVDHYSLDWKWENKIRTNINYIVAIDDLNNRKHNCNMIIDQNYRKSYQALYQNNLNPTCKLFLGPKYSLINPVYAKYKKKVFSSKIKKILIFFGGGDPNFLTELILENLSDKFFQKIKINVVTGMNNNRGLIIKNKYKNNKNIKFYERLTDLASLLYSSDLAIGALGINTWERMCVGVPSLVISTGKDQEIFAKLLKDKRFIYLLGYAEKIKKIKLKNDLRKYFLKKYSKKDLLNLQKIVDGNGSMRVATEIKKRFQLNIKYKIKLRSARHDDDELLLKWANEPFVRANAFMSEPIEKRIHKKWFDSRLNDQKNHKLYIAFIKYSNNPIGQVRFDLIENYWHIDFSIDPNFRDQGYGTNMLYLAIKKLSQQDQKNLVIGQVKKNNVSSYNVFKKLHFQLSNTNRNIITFQKKLNQVSRVYKEDFMSTKKSLMEQNIVPNDFKIYKGTIFQYRWITDHKSDEILKGRNEKHVLNEFPENVRINRKIHKAFIEDYNNLARLDFVISPSMSDEIVGALYVIVHDGELEMGKYIGNINYLNKGVASAATSSFIEFIKKYFPLHDLVAVTKKTNTNNIKLNMKKKFFIEKDLNNGFIKMRLTLR